MSSKNTTKDVFDEVWERIREETPIKNMVQLAVIVETSQQNVSKRKKEKNFPIEWAFKVAQKYNLLTEWIVTGEGPKRLSEASDGNPKTAFNSVLAEWLQEQCQDNPHFYANFTAECAAYFPEFAKWLKKRKT